MSKDQTAWRLVAAVAVGVALLAAGLGRADDEGPNKGAISLSLTNDFTNTYMFRGIQQERDGFIWQPYVDVGLTVWDDADAPIKSVTLGMGVWNSFQSEKTLSRGSGPSNLYETDFYPSLTVGLPGNFETSI